MGHATSPCCASTANWAERATTPHRRRCGRQGAINNGRPVSVEEIRSQLEDIHRAFPDHASTALETTASGDLVIVLTRTSGTHRGVAQTDIYGGMLRGAQPLGKHFEVLRAHWWRFKDGKIVWHQVVSDDLGMMRQLGLIPDTLPAGKLVRPARD